MLFRSSVQKCAEGYLHEIESKKGGVVLMHTLKTQSVQMVNILIPELKARGYHFARLDEVPGFDQYRTPPDGKPAVAIAAAENIPAP